MDVAENVSLVSMLSLIMNRLGLSKDFTDADRNLIGEELCKAAKQSNVPCSKVLPKLSLTFLYDNVDFHMLNYRRVHGISQPAMDHRNR